MKQTMFTKVRDRLYQHPILTMLLFWMVYMVCFNMLEKSPRPVHLIECSWDAYIPFASSAVIPYIGWFLWVPIVLLYMMRTDRDQFWRGFGSMVGGIVFTLALYAVWPTGLNLRGAVMGNDLCSNLVRLIYLVDTPTNVCPSLHVFITVVLLLTLWEKLGTWGRWCNGLIAFAICCSTVLLDQHSLVDVVMGFALAVVMWSIAEWRRMKKLERVKA